jgi:hypothetical protein
MAGATAVIAGRSHVNSTVSADEALIDKPEADYMDDYG